MASEWIVSRGCKLEGSSRVLKLLLPLFLKKTHVSSVKHKENMGFFGKRE